MKNLIRTFFKPFKLVAPAVMLLAALSPHSAIAADTTVACGGFDQDGWYVSATQAVASPATSCAIDITSFFADALNSPGGWSPINGPLLHSNFSSNGQNWTCHGGTYTTTYHKNMCSADGDYSNQVVISAYSDAAPHHTVSCAPGVLNDWSFTATQDVHELETSCRFTSQTFYSDALDIASARAKASFTSEGVDWSCITSTSTASSMAATCTANNNPLDKVVVTGTGPLPYTTLNCPQVVVNNWVLDTTQDVQNTTNCDIDTNSFFSDGLVWQMLNNGSNVSEPRMNPGGFTSNSVDWSCVTNSANDYSVDSTCIATGNASNKVVISAFYPPSAPSATLVNMNLGNTNCSLSYEVLVPNRGKTSLFQGSETLPAVVCGRAQSVLEGVMSQIDPNNFELTICWNTADCNSTLTDVYTASPANSGEEWTATVTRTRQSFGTGSTIEVKQTNIIKIAVPGTNVTVQLDETILPDQLE